MVNSYLKNSRKVGFFFVFVFLFRERERERERGREIQPMASTPDDSSLSSDQNPNQFLV